MTTLRDINCSEASDRAAFFVLGALDAREAAEVREHLRTCSRAHEEFAEIGGVVPHLAELPEPLDPPSELRGRIVSAVEADVRARRREGDAAERLVASFGARPLPAAAPSTDVTAAGVAVGPGRPTEPAAPEAGTGRTDSDAANRPATEISETAAVADMPAAPSPTLVTSAESAPAASPATAPPGTPPQPTSVPPTPPQPTSVLQQPTQPMSSQGTPLEAALPASPPVVPVTQEAAASAAPEPTRIDRAERTERRRPSLGRWLVAAAALVAIVALAGWNVLLQSRAAQEHRRTEALAAALIARNTPNAAVAVLAGTEAAPTASGTAIMPPGRPGYLLVQGLQPAPAGKTYQAWYVSGNETRSAGLLKVADDGMGVMTGLDPGTSVEAMAVTLENEGGVERSTQPPLVFGRIANPGS